MFKKIFCLFFIIGSHFAYASIDVEDELITIQTPQRFGCNGLLQSIELKYVLQGPADNHFNLTDNLGPVLKGNMVYNSSTQYDKITPFGPRQPVGSPLNRVIKDRINAYGVTRVTFDSYEEKCFELDQILGSNLVQQINRLRITINPNDIVCSAGNPNAYYERTGSRGGLGHINFCAGLSFDLVAHEVGHSILDVLQPDLYGYPRNHPYSALHESFGDLSAIFASVNLGNLSAIRLSLIRNNQTCIVPNWPNKPCLRIPESYKGTSCEAHDHSNYFTNFINKSMVDSFSGFSDKEQNAVFIYNFFQKLIIYTAHNFKQFNSLYEFGIQMFNKTPVLLPSDRHFKIEEKISTIIQNALRKNLNNLQVPLQSCAVTL